MSRFETTQAQRYTLAMEINESTFINLQTLLQVVSH